MSLVLREERDLMGRSQCMVALGAVARQRFKDALTKRWPEEEVLRHLNESVRCYQEALDLLPPDAISHLAVTHNQLGFIFAEAGHFDRAVHHFRESIHYDEAQDNLYPAAQARFHVALILADAGRRADALEYAEAALRGFKQYGAGERIEKTRQFIAELRGT